MLRRLINVTPAHSLFVALFSSNSNDRSEEMGFYMPSHSDLIKRAEASGKT